MISKKRKLSTKGFSLIELLGVMVILGILAVISISAVTRYIDQSRRQKVVQNKKNVAIAAELYLQANRDLMPKMIGEVVYVPLSDLRNTNYIKEDVTNEKGEDCMKESFVRVFKLAEGDYNYTTYLYCGDEKAPANVEPPTPYLDDLMDENEHKSVKVLFSTKEDVKKANFSFKLKGGKDKQTGESIGLYSYSYSILVKISPNQKYYDDNGNEIPQDQTFTEIYNSGTIGANRNPAIEFKSRPISSYVDLAGVTAVQVKITALNEQGGFLSYVTEGIGAAGGQTQYDDTVKPICPAYDDVAGRIGEPREFDDWLGKEKIGTNEYPRVITLKCEDGDGSGCKRDTFTESWPNEEKDPFGVMFGQITLEDNSVVDINGNIKEPNKEICPINVFVDLQSPSVEITPINPSPKDGHATNVGKDMEYRDKKWQKTVTVHDSEDYPKKDNLDEITMTITDLNYEDVFNEYDKDEGWLNEEYFPEGIEYDIILKDNIYLYGYTWEVNEPYLNTRAPYLKEVSMNNPESVAWFRYDDPEMAIDEDALMQTRVSLTADQNVLHITIGFKEEGARYGILKVFDRAGNETTIYIYANLDRTYPPIEDHDYGIQKFEINEGGIRYIEVEYPDTTELEDTLSADEGEAIGIDINDDMFQGYDVCDDEAYLGKNDGPAQITTTGAQIGTPGNVVDCIQGKTKYNKPGEVPKACVVLNHDAYGTYYGSDDQIVEREETGCYKIGTVKGDNGIEQKDYLDDSIFETLEEYKSGTWSNEELVCGPKTDMTLDNFYTRFDSEGNKERVEIPDEISGWVGVHLLYYRQKGVKKVYDETETPHWRYEYDKKQNIGKEEVVEEEPQPQQTLPIYEVVYSDSEDDTEFVKHYMITSLDRETWPILEDQGTHQIQWKNCDKAGNCSEYALKENVKIDTINPKCYNSIVYNDELNSDSLKGPNHNGWLYDQQAATVYHGCADSSHYDVESYFDAMTSIKNSILGLPDYRYYSDEDYVFDEFASGCARSEEHTDKTKLYDQDVYTCEAGTDGVQKYGTVLDVAGNITECSNGVSIWKDTTPPLCGTSIIYNGTNSEDEEEHKYNVPNRYGWANGGMTAVIMKTCNDSTDAKVSAYPVTDPPSKRDENGNILSAEEYDKLYAEWAEGEKVYSGCRRSDSVNYEDYYNSLYKSRIPSTYTVTQEMLGYSNFAYKPPKDENGERAGLVKVDDKTYYYQYLFATDSKHFFEEDYGNGGYYFIPSNNASYSIEQTDDVKGKVGAEGAIPTYHEAGTVYLDKNEQKPLTDEKGREVVSDYSYVTLEQQGGYMMDQAGNISERPCKLATAAKDSKEPTCKNRVTAMNTMQVTTGEDGEPRGVFHYGEYNKSRNEYDKWVGSVGKNGHEEYIKVYKGCNDVPVPNYPGVAGVALSLCDQQYLGENVPGNYWLYGNVYEFADELDRQRNTPGSRKGSAGVTFEGPDANPTGEAVRDYAGNHGVGLCNPVDANIDYYLPKCQVVVSETGIWRMVGFKYPDYDPNTLHPVIGNASTLYKGTDTNQSITAYARCVSDYDEVVQEDIASGCDDIGDGSDKVLITKQDEFTGEWTTERTGERKKEFAYIGANHDETVELYTTDHAGNAKLCTVEEGNTFRIKQDKKQPEGTCSFWGDYVKDYENYPSNQDHHHASYMYIRIDSIGDYGGDPDDYTVGIYYPGQDYTAFDNARRDSWVYQGKPLSQNTNFDQDTRAGSRIGSNKTYNGRYSNLVKVEPGVMLYKIPLSCNTVSYAAGVEKMKGIMLLVDKNGNFKYINCDPDESMGMTKDYIEVPFCCERPDENNWVKSEPVWGWCPECGDSVRYHTKTQTWTTTSLLNEKVKCTKSIALDEEPCPGLPLDCCSRQQYYSSCGAAGSSNPCDFGLYESYSYSAFQGNANIYCDNQNRYSLCQANESECRRLSQNNYSSTPTSKSCQLRIIQNTKADQDIVLLDKSSNSSDYCRISGVSNYSCQFSYNKDDAAIRLSVTKLGSSNYNPKQSYSYGCSLTFNWTSTNTSELNFGSSQFKSQTVFVAKCDNKTNHFLRDGSGNVPDYIYCISHGVVDSPTNSLGQHICPTTSYEASAYCRPQEKGSSETPNITPDDDPPAVITPKPSVDPYDDDRD